jgi:hypothetical protein
MSMRKIALLLDLPEGKLPGFYAQIVKGLAQRTTLFDRDKELLVLNTSEDRDAVLELLHHYNVPSEEMLLLLLPPAANLFAVFSDYGFISRAERHYLYDHLVSIFCFTKPSAAHSEQQQALLQMQEHLIADFHLEDARYYAVDQHMSELMDRIAKAYHCSISFIQT